MIKFFRKIRQQLLAENKVSKYLLYAIGEIILVVIGILIALNINNWNEKKLQYVKDIEFLKGLKSELTIDSTNLSKRIYNSSLRNNRINNSLVSLDTLVNITAKQYQEIVDSFLVMEILTPIGKNLRKNDIALANGTLARIDQLLNDKYLDYLELTESQNNVISKLGETLQQTTVQYVMPIIDMQNDTISIDIQSEFNKIRKNRLLKNTLVQSIRKRNTHLYFMEDQLNSANALMVSIDSLLNGSK